MAKTTSKKKDISANLGFEAKLWAVTDSLRVLVEVPRPYWRKAERNLAFRCINPQIAQSSH
jgi:hypothetical protein